MSHGIWRDTVFKGATIMGHRSQQFCINGHEFTPENTYWRRRKNGQLHRRCRTCHLESGKLWEEYKRVSPKKKVHCEVNKNP